jgi:hypothetical protein
MRFQQPDAEKFKDNWKRKFTSAGSMSFNRPFLGTSLALAC